VIAKAKTERLQDKIVALKKQMQNEGDRGQLNETPDKQISLTDPDARSMKTREPVLSATTSRPPSMQAPLIVAHEVTMSGLTMSIYHPWRSSSHRDGN